MAEVPVNTIVKWRALVDGLTSLTGKGAVSWRIGADEDEFYTSFPEHVIRVTKIRSVNEEGFDEEKFVVKIANKTGSEIDIFDTEDISDGFNTYRHRLEDLRKQIIRKTSGAEAELDKLLREVNKLERDHPF